MFPFQNARRSGYSARASDILFWQTLAYGKSAANPATVGQPSNCWDKSMKSLKIELSYDWSEGTLVGRSVWYICLQTRASTGLVVTTALRLQH